MATTYKENEFEKLYLDKYGNKVGVLSKRSRIWYCVNIKTGKTFHSWRGDLKEID